MNQNILVIAIRKFKGEVAGSEHDFTKVTYIPSDNNAINTDNEKGNYPKEVAYKTSKEFDELSKFDYPSVFNATFDIVQGRKNLQVNLLELEHVHPLEVI